MSKKVIIIGGGIAGLCAGSYLRMNGYQTHIFEMHSLPGGLCTSWQRKGYTVDFCIHWLVGSNPESSFYKLWNELIPMKKIPFIDHHEYIRVEDKDGNFISVSTDLDQFESAMLNISPQDKEPILEMTQAVRKLMQIDLPVEKTREVMGVTDKIKFGAKMMPFMPLLKKWSTITAADYASRFKHPLLQRTIKYLFAPDMVMLFILMTLGWFHKKYAGYPLIGGSLNFARLVEQRYLQLGGQISYNSTVSKIIVKDGIATGIQLENQQIHQADIVISAADGHATIFDMLEGKYIDDKISNYYENYKIFPSLLQVSLGVNKLFPNEPHTLFFPIDEPLIVDPQMTNNEICYQLYNYDSTLAPQGKTLITVLLPTYNYSYWIQLRQENPEQYRLEKERIANTIIDILDKKLGHIKDNLEMIDVSSPATLIRYTGNWKGSFEGWQLTPEVGLDHMDKTLPNLKNFYMIGQWVHPGGGLPTCVMSGRGVTQIICKQDKKEFETQSF